MNLNTTTTPIDLESADDIALADKMKNGRQQVIAELGKRIIGQAEIIELVLQTLFVGGNSLIVGVPGLAKTLLIATLAKVLELKFNRIQFTPDLMPGDIIGTNIVREDESGRKAFEFDRVLRREDVERFVELIRPALNRDAVLLHRFEERRLRLRRRAVNLIRQQHVREDWAFA